MNRKDLYTQIKSLKLEDAVKAAYKDNYTRCTNEQLLAIITKNTAEAKAAKKSKISDCKCAKLKTLVDVLVAKHLLLKSEATKILNA